MQRIPPLFLCKERMIHVVLTLGTRIQSLRKAQGITQAQLAGKLGITAPAVSKWERDIAYPDIMLLYPLSKTLRVSLDTLLSPTFTINGS
jgi:transcriptional regulator with XRE-family HTH domain